ncbi:hypothetical protein FQN50_009975 [Emmonsiellopsis sp. PD_5]|nr:hypothetical protein FQN50_009975 [Emmonsiellopsis sp. PD_5]
MIGRWLSELPWDGSTQPKSEFSRPLLRRFAHHEEKIKYLEFLGSGGEGVVYRVTIAGREYAMKIFKKWTYYGPIMKLSERAQPYMSPFSRECRAFARLHNMGQNGTWAVKCHGWLKLSEGELNRFQRRWGRSLSPWAIIKDYIPNPVALADVPEIQRKITIARKARLYPRDCGPENFRGSFLVDLGSVRTYPFPVWNDRCRRAFFDSFPEHVGEWQESIEDGTVIAGWLNDELKRNREASAKLEQSGLR